MDSLTPEQGIAFLESLQCQRHDCQATRRELTVLRSAQLLADVQPLVTALIAAVKMERDEFHERCNNSYSTDALMLAKERVALCKAALLDAMRPRHVGSEQCDRSGG